MLGELLGERLRLPPLADDDGLAPRLRLRLALSVRCAAANSIKSSGILLPGGAFGRPLGLLPIFTCRFALLCDNGEAKSSLYSSPSPALAGVAVAAAAPAAYASNGVVDDANAVAGEGDGDNDRREWPTRPG
jgi:hypothetical protein